MRAFHHLGASTSDWKSICLKRLVTLGVSRTEDRSQGLPYLGMENIESWTGRRIETNTPVSQANGENETGGLSNQFEKGDVLFGKLRPYLAKAHVANEPGLCSTELLVLRPKPDLLNAYLLRLMLTNEVVTLVDSSTFGSKMPRADWDFIGNVELPIPPLATQQRIAAYLDRETARIDALIAAKERLLALLAEKRRSLITHAVTRGLNPHAKLKDSGLPWLGLVPAGWEVKRLRFELTSIEQGWSPQCENRPAEADEWGVLKVGCVNGDEFNPDEQKALPPNVEPETRYEVTTDDILISRGNTLVLVGSASLVRTVRTQLLLCDLLCLTRCRLMVCSGFRSCA